MYYISKRMEISACHTLRLNYESKCASPHGHNWLVTVFCFAERLDENGMVADFKHIKEKIHNRLDHKNLNDLFSFNPTAENLAKWITDEIPQCYKTIVQESEKNVAVYVDDEKLKRCGNGAL